MEIVFLLKIPLTYGNSVVSTHLKKDVLVFVSVSDTETDTCDYIQIQCIHIFQIITGVDVLVSISCPCLCFCPCFIVWKWVCNGLIWGWVCEFIYSIWCTPISKWMPNWFLTWKMIYFYFTIIVISIILVSLRQ